MLFIRPDQRMAFSVDGMERQVMAFLREEFPACFAHADRNALRALIGRALAPATGMRTEHDIARYAMLGLIIRPDFDSHPATQWAWPEPGDQGRNGEARLNRLYALARRHGYTLAAAGVPVRRHRTRRSSGGGVARGGVT